MSRSRWLVALAGMAIAGAGCESSADDATRSTHSRHGSRGGDSPAVRVIRAWSTALRRGDVVGAARYFALPSEFINGPPVTIHTESEAQAVNATLPCGAVLLSFDQRGPHVSALFRLTNRPGPNAGCGSGAGQLARTNFVIVRGRILEWIRVPESGGAAPGPAAPSTTGSGGPVV